MRIFAIIPRSSIGETNHTLPVQTGFVNLVIPKKRESFCFFPPSVSNRGNGFRKKLRLTPADRKDILQRKNWMSTANPQNEERFPASLNARPMSPIWIPKPHDLPRHLRCQSFQSDFKEIFNVEKCSRKNNNASLTG